MGSKSYKNFDRAYKKALQDYKYAINIGAYKYVGDYRDMVNDGVVELFKKFELDDENFAYKQILMLIKRATAWARIRKIRYKKNQTQYLHTTHLSQYEFELDTYTFLGSNDYGTDHSFDTNLFNTNFKLVKSRVDGYTRQDELNDGKFKTMRVAQYAHEKEYERLRRFIEVEQKRASIIYE